MPRLAALWPLLFLVGCLPAVRPVPPMSPDLLGDRVPATVLAPPSATIETPNRLTAPAVGAPVVFTLSEAIRFALRNNPRLDAARADIGRSEGLEQAAFSPFLPQLDVLTRIGSTSRGLSPGAPGPTGAIIPAVIDSGYTYIQAEIQLQWMLCDFGRTAGRYHQALSQERIANLRFERAQETIAFDVTVEYLSVLLASAARQVQTESIRRAESVLRDTEVRRAAGVAQRDDVLRARVQVAEGRDALAVAENQEWAALSRLNAVMGRSAALPLKVIDVRSEPTLALSLAEYLHTAESTRRELAVAREAVAAARSGRDAAAAEFLPYLSGRASLGAVDGENIVKGAQEGAGLHLNVPLYAGGRHRGELRAAEAELAQAVANSATVLDNVSLEVTVAYHAAEIARSRIDLARPAVADATENLRLVRVKYGNGDATSTDIADAEATLTRVAQRFISAGYEYLAALARLDYALGRPQGSFLQPARRPDPPAALGQPRPAPR
jgi:outer membrane protein